MISLGQREVPSEEQWVIDLPTVVKVTDRSDI